MIFAYIFSIIITMPSGDVREVVYSQPTMAKCVALRDFEVENKKIVATAFKIGAISKCEEVRQAK